LKPQPNKLLISFTKSQVYC